MVRGSKYRAFILESITFTWLVSLLMIRMQWWQASRDTLVPVPRLLSWDAGRQAPLQVWVARLIDKVHLWVVVVAVFLVVRVIICIWVVVCVAIILFIGLVGSRANILRKHRDINCLGDSRHNRWYKIFWRDCSQRMQDGSYIASDQTEAWMIKVIQEHSSEFYV